MGATVVGGSVSVVVAAGDEVVGAVAVTSYGSEVTIVGSADDEHPAATTANAAINHVDLGITTSQRMVEG